VPRQKASHRTGVAIDFCLYISLCRGSINIQRSIPCKQFLWARTARQLGSCRPLWNAGQRSPVLLSAYRRKPQLFHRGRM